MMQADVSSVVTDLFRCTLHNEIMRCEAYKYDRT